MIHATFGGARSAQDIDLHDFLVGARLEAAKAFRVLRDARTLDVACEIELFSRAPDGQAVARLVHPGLWSVTLEPRVTAISLTEDDGRDLEGVAELFRRNPQVNTLARFSGPHLDAWARGRPDLIFRHPAILRRTALSGLHVYGEGGEIAALRSAIASGYAGVLHRQGGAVLATEADISGTAELMLLAEQAAKVELLAGRAPAWA